MQFFVENRWRYFDLTSVFIIYFVIWPYQGFEISLRLFNIPIFEIEIYAMKFAGEVDACILTIMGIAGGFRRDRGKLTANSCDD